jgi:predicted  nucleic acid-binding Zn-ribbon protein
VNRGSSSLSKEAIILEQQDQRQQSQDLVAKLWRYVNIHKSRGKQWSTLQEFVSEFNQDQADNNSSLKLTLDAESELCLSRNGSAPQRATALLQQCAIHRDQYFVTLEVETFKREQFLDYLEIGRKEPAQLPTYRPQIVAPSKGSKGLGYNHHSLAHDITSLTHQLVQGSGQEPDGLSILGASTQLGALATLAVTQLFRGSDQKDLDQLKQLQTEIQEREQTVKDLRSRENYAQKRIHDLELNQLGAEVLQREQTVQGLEIRKDNAETRIHELQQIATQNPQAVEPVLPTQLAAELPLSPNHLRGQEIDPPSSVTTAPEVNNHVQAPLANPPEASGQPEAARTIDINAKRAEPKASPESITSVQEMIEFLREKLKGLDMQIARLETRVTGLETQLNLLETQLQGALQIADADIARSQNAPVQVTSLTDTKNRAYVEIRVADVPEGKRWEEIYPNQSSMAAVTDVLDRLPRDSTVKIVCSASLQPKLRTDERARYQRAVGNHSIDFVNPSQIHVTYGQPTVQSLQSESIDQTEFTQGNILSLETPKQQAVNPAPRLPDNQLTKLVKPTVPKQNPQREI